MANPNLLAATTALGTTTYLTPSAGLAKVLLPNAAGSGQVFKINHIRATNTTGSAADAQVSIYTNGSVAQGGNPSGGTEYQLTGLVSIAVDGSLIVVDKTTQIYLQEGTSIIVDVGTSAAIDFVISYEVIYV
jgi:hypothetical protein